MLSCIMQHIFEKEFRDEARSTLNGLPTSNRASDKASCTVSAGVPSTAQALAAPGGMNAPISYRCSKGLCSPPKCLLPGTCCSEHDRSCLRVMAWLCADLMTHKSAHQAECKQYFELLAQHYLSPSGAQTRILAKSAPCRAKTRALRPGAWIPSSLVTKTVGRELLSNSILKLIRECTGDTIKAAYAGGASGSLPWTKKSAFCSKPQRVHSLLGWLVERAGLQRSLSRLHRGPRKHFKIQTCCLNVSFKGLPGSRLAHPSPKENSERPHRAQTERNPESVRVSA